MGLNITIGIDQHIILPILALLALLIIIPLIWPFRYYQLTKVFLILLGAVIWWLLCFIMEHSFTTLPDKIFWVRMSYFGIVTIPVAWLILTILFTEKDYWLTRNKILLLCIIPLISLLIVWTSDLHKMMWQDIWLDNTLYPPDDAVIHGPWFWVLAVYCYILLLWGFILLIRYYIRAPSSYRKQILILLAALLPPWIVNIIYFKSAPLLVDFTPIAFSVTGILFYWGLSQTQFTRLIPVVYKDIFDSLPEGIIVTDLQNRIVAINSSALQIIKKDKKSVQFKKIQSVAPPEWGEITLQENNVRFPPVIVTESANNHTHYSINVLPVKIKQRYSGNMIIFHDDTKANRLAITDELTGLFNKRHLDRSLEAEIARSERLNSRFSLIMMDIDHFKKANDTYGHLAGDNLLGELSQIMNSLIRTMDLAFRYGGDEFAIILPGASLNEAEKVARRLLLAIQNNEALAKYGITVSMGIASWPEDGRTANELIARADAALYLAKKAGRNRICLSTQLASDNEKIG